MKQIDNAINGNNITNLQTEIKLQECIYIALLKADEPLSKLKPVRLRIRELKKDLKVLSNVVLLDTLG